jgi:hypothetical protein
VSAILDALRRNQPEDDGPPHGDSHSDAVLATLGYPRERPRKRGLSIKMLLVYGEAAVTIGLVGLPADRVFRAARAAAAPAGACRDAGRRACAEDVRARTVTGSGDATAADADAAREREGCRASAVHAAEDDRTGKTGGAAAGHRACHAATRRRTVRGLRSFAHGIAEDGCVVPARRFGVAAAVSEPPPPPAVVVAATTDRPG